MEEIKNVEFALNDHFFDFVDDWNHKIYFLVGGYGSSKSYHIAVKLIKKLLEEKRKALVVREVFETIRDSCFDLLQEVAASVEAYVASWIEISRRVPSGTLHRVEAYIAL